MKKVSLIKYLLPLAFASLTIASCSKDNDGKEEEVQPNLSIDELKGQWMASGSLFDLETEGKGYLLDLDFTDPIMDGFKHDENGDYITISIQDYCKQYAADYNADPDNKDKMTAEDVAERIFSEELVTTFTIMSDYIMFEQGNLAGSATIISGESVYSQENQTFTITKDILGEEGSVVEIKVKRGRTDGEVMFLVTSEYYPYKTATYDGKDEYWFLTPTWYFCKMKVNK